MLLGTTNGEGIGDEGMFTMETGRWYACESIGDEFTWEHDLRSYSPIRVDELEPLKTGDQQFELRFVHGNYPSGVQDKVYRLQTLHRGDLYMLVRSLNHTPTRLLLIYGLAPDWIQRHFPNIRDDDPEYREWFGE